MYTSLTKNNQSRLTKTAAFSNVCCSTHPELTLTKKVKYIYLPSHLKQS